MEMKRAFTIDGILMGMNKYSNAQRTHWTQGARVKKTQTDIVALSARLLEPIPETAYPLSVIIRWYEPNRKRDPDNIASAKKFILDGLQKAGILKNDGWREISHFVDFFDVDKKNPRVEIVLYWRK